MRWEGSRVRGWGLTPAVLLALVLSACGGSGGGSGGSSTESDTDSTTGSDTETESTESGPDLSEVQLADTQAEQMHYLAVLDLPDDVASTDLYATYQRAGADTHPTEAEDDLRVPLLNHDDEVVVVTPLVDLDGAQIELVITDGDNHGPVLDLALDPLPARRHGAVDELLAAFDSALEATATEIGLSYPDSLEHWRDHDFDMMPVTLLPLMRTWLSIMDTENPESLAAQAQTLSSDELVFLERVLADQRMASALDGLAEMLAEDGTLLGNASGVMVTPQHHGHHRQRASDTPTSQSVPLADAGEDAARFDGSQILNIEDPATLSVEMKAYRSARDLQESLDLFSDIFGTYVMMAAIVTGPLGATAAAGLVAGVNGAVKAADGVGTLSQMYRWVAPCCIRDVDGVLDPPTARIANEDAMPNQLGVDEVTVTVESEGVDLVREAIERAWGQLKKHGMKAELKEFLAEEVADAVMAAAEPMLDSWLDEIDGVEIVFVWDDIDLVDQTPGRWLEHRIDTTYPVGGYDPIIELASPLEPMDAAPFEFRLRAPKAFEGSPLNPTRLRLTPDREEFPQGSWSAVVSTESTEVGLNHIDVVFDPSSHRSVAEGEQVQFVVSAEHAVVDDLSEPEITGPGEIISVTRDYTGGFYELTYQAPDDLPEDPPITEILMYSTSEKGIRGHEEAPERWGTGFVSFVGHEEDEDDADGEPPEYECDPPLQSADDECGSVTAVWRGRTLPPDTPDFIERTPGGSGEMEITPSWTEPGGGHHDTGDWRLVRSGVRPHTGCERGAGLSLHLDTHFDFPPGYTGEVTLQAGQTGARFCEYEGADYYSTNTSEMSQLGDVNVLITRNETEPDDDYLGGISPGVIEGIVLGIPMMASAETPAQLISMDVAFSAIHYPPRADSGSWPGSYQPPWD